MSKSFNNHKEQVLSFISNEMEDNGVDAEEVEETMTFSELGLDSIDVLSLVIETEHHYGIEVSDDEVERLRTIGGFCKIIDSKVLV